MSRTGDEEIALSETNEEFKRDIERRFKPLFDQYPGDALPISEVLRECEAQGMADHIPRDRMNQLLQKGDLNKDEKIDFKEFMKLLTGSEMKATERSAFQNVLGVAIENIVPRRLREDFMANYNCRPPPVFMILISIVEIVIFAVYAAEQNKLGIPTTATSGVPAYSPLVFKPSRRYEVWRFITYMLIHQGYVHLLSNLIFQLCLGLPLEVVHKWWRLLLIYTLGVLAGSLAHSITDTYVPLVGASGGCYALIGAHIASVIVNWKEMNYKICEGSFGRALLSAPVRLAVLLLFSSADTGMAIYRRYAGTEAVKVGISAHIGGLAAGLLLGVPIMKNVNKLKWERNLGWVTLVVYLLFVVFAVLFNGFYKGYPTTDWTACCP